MVVVVIIGPTSVCYLHLHLHLHFIESVKDCQISLQLSRLVGTFYIVGVVIWAKILVIAAPPPINHIGMYGFIIWARVQVIILTC